MRVDGFSPHMRDMATFANPHVLAHPVRHRITLIETPADVEYFATSCNGSPDSSGNYTAAFSMPVPVLGSYLVEELDAEGELSGLFELIATEDFMGRFVEVGRHGLEYGVRGTGVRSVGGNVEPAKNIVAARFGAKFFKYRMPVGTFEVVSRPAFSDDEWTVVGR